MLVSNGIKTRNIPASLLAEYTAKGYSEVKTQDEKKTPKKGK